MKAQQNQVLAAKGAQWNQTSTTKSKNPANDVGAKPTNTEKHPSKKQSIDGHETTQAKAQAISVSYIAEFETDSDSE